MRTLSKKLLFMDIVLDDSTLVPASMQRARFEVIATHRDGHSVENIAALAREVCE